MQRSMIARYVVAEHDESPWVFVHGDLHNGNIIVDDELNICGSVSVSLYFISFTAEAH